MIYGLYLTKLYFCLTVLELIIVSPVLKPLLPEFGVTEMSEAS